MPHQRKEMSATEHRSMGIHEANGWSVIQCACGWQYQSDCHTREELQHFYEEHRVASRREPGRDEGESKLLPCPFCNSEPSIDETKGVCWIVYCPNDECDIRPETGFQQTREEAIYNWNRRAPSESQSLCSQLAADDERMWEMAHQVAVLQQKLATAGEVIAGLCDAASSTIQEWDATFAAKIIAERGFVSATCVGSLRSALTRAEEFRKGIARKEDSRHAD